MTRAPCPELRVLTGIHAGARVLLPSSPQVVGRSYDCDLILSDEGMQEQHVRLEPQPDGSLIVHWLAEELAPTLLTPGQGLQLGPVQIAVEEADTPWRTDTPMLAVAHESSHEELEGQHGTDDAAQVASAGESAAAVPASLSAWRRRAVTLGVSAALLLCALTGASVWWSRPGLPPALPQAAPAPVPSLDSEQIAQVVDSLGMADHVRIEAETGRLPVVHASFLPDDQTEALATALSRLSPRPGLRLVGEADVLMTVSDVLQRHPGPDAASLKARYLGNGRFRVEGRVLDASERQALLARLAEAAPDARGFESALLTEAESATAMLDDLRARGIEHVAGTWADGVLQLKVRLEPSQVPRWERALLAAAAAHKLPFRAVLDLQPVQMAKLEPLPPPPAIRSVVSGAHPYVVLANGNKLMVEGRTDQWRLVNIAARSVVFETTQGRQLTVER